MASLALFPLALTTTLLGGDAVLVTTLAFATLVARISGSWACWYSASCAVDGQRRRRGPPRDAAAYRGNQDGVRSSGTKGEDIDA